MATTSRSGRSWRRATWPIALLVLTLIRAHPAPHKNSHHTGFCGKTDYSRGNCVHATVATTERVVGSLLAQCGVATVAIYFPGFHKSIDNDMLWGEKWTEWDNLFTDNGSDPLLHDFKAHHELLHPQRGYYDIWDAHARTIHAQAQQAAAAGFQAFMFCAPLSDRYLIGIPSQTVHVHSLADHYWFAHGRTALTRPIEDALFSATSGAPRRLGLSFFFSWANEPWEKRWNVAVSDRTATSKPITLIPQEYGGPKSWEGARHPRFHPGTRATPAPQPLNIARDPSAPPVSLALPAPLRTLRLPATLLPPPRLRPTPRYPPNHSNL